MLGTLLLGLAWQRGLIPVREAAILRAIELNGAAVAMNHRAFLWGRILAERPDLVDAILVHRLEAPPKTLDALIEARADALVAYQNAALAARYRALVNEVAAREATIERLRILLAQSEANLAEMRELIGGGPAR